MFNACFKFSTEGTPISCERYGNGHINETYLVVTDKGVWYILQKINNRVFKDVPGLMHNISSVSAYLYEMLPDPRRVLTIVPPLEGGSYLKDETDTGACIYLLLTAFALNAQKAREIFTPAPLHLAISRTCSPALMPTALMKP